jgi:carbonic anhydrase
MSNLFKGMSKVIRGIFSFQQNVHGEKEELFQRLGKGQNPLVLFVACSDSRVNPNLLTQTDPGELFILRNAGNIVPAYGAGGGEEATVEYAVAQLKVRHVVVCGHSHCGAVHGLLEPHAVTHLPSVGRWLANAREVVPRVERAGAGVSGADRLNLAVEQNVLVQLDHLRTHPAVAAGLETKQLKLHGWVYHFETGRVMAYDSASQRFIPLSEVRALMHSGLAPTEPRPQGALDCSM